MFHKKYNKNFINNQNYIKNKNFDKDFYKAKILYYFISNLLDTFIFFSISIFLFIIIFKVGLFEHSGLIYKENLDYFYFNKKFIFFYFFIIISTFLSVFYKIKLLKILQGNSLKVSYDFIKNWKKKIFIILSLFFGLLIFLYFLNFIFAFKIFLFGFLVLNIHFLFDFNKFSKEKLLIKKPFFGYSNIFKSIEKNNIFIRNYRKKVSKNKISIIYLIIFSIFFLYLVFSIGKLGFHQNTAYYFMSTNLNNLVRNEKLNLKNKNLGYESTKNIFNYMKEYGISKLNIANNNYSNFIYSKNNEIFDKIGDMTIHYNDLEIEEINYGDIKNYYKDSNPEKLFKEYYLVKKYYNKIYFNDLTKYYTNNISVFSLKDKYKLFALFYLIDNKKINKLILNWKLNVNLFTLYNNDFNSDEKKANENLLLLLNSNYIFEKGFNVKFINTFFKSNNIKKEIEYLTRIYNPNLKVTFFDIDYFCKKYPNKFDCNILKEKFDDISNDDKEKILLNNNYIISNYGKFYQNNEYKNNYHQSILLNVYFALDNRKTSLKKLDLSNNYINSVFFENVVSKFVNINTIILGNIESDKKLIIDLDETNIDNFNISSSKIFFQESNNIRKNILIDSNYKTNSKTLSNNYIDFPNIFVTKEGYSRAIGCGKNNLFNNKKYSVFPNNYKLGHYKFSNDFINGLYLQNWNTHKITDYLYSFYFKNIFLNKELTEKEIKNFLEKYNNDKYFKYKLDLFIKVNNVKVNGYYTGLSYDFFRNNPNLEGNEKIKEFFKYIIKSKKFKRYLADLKMFQYFNFEFFEFFEKNQKNSSYNKFIDKKVIKFKEIFKLGNNYIFVKK